MPAHKIVFSGPVGVGKTTAITTISDIECVSTEEKASDEVKNIKQNTTVALDYGMINLLSDEVIHLYGTPGQSRFDFMWDILTEGAIGLVLLINNEEADALKTAAGFLAAFDKFIKQTSVVIGVTRLDKHPSPSLEDYYLMASDLDIHCPIFEVDPRERTDTCQLIRALMYDLDPGLTEAA